MDDKAQQILAGAREVFATNPTWVEFYRQILGFTDGIAHTLITSKKGYTEFERSPEFKEIQGMLATLRGRGDPPPTSKDPGRIITVRLPTALHTALRQEAHDKHTSLNKLCVTKLLQPVDPTLVPPDSKIPVEV